MNFNTSRSSSLPGVKDKAIAGPKENIDVIFFINQIVALVRTIYLSIHSFTTLVHKHASTFNTNYSCCFFLQIIPYMTPRASAIRQWMHTHCITPENKKIFLFRNHDKYCWTNIDLMSTPTDPKVTMDPIAIVHKMEEVWNLCPHVDKVTFKTEDGVARTADEIALLPFEALEPTGPIDLQNDVTTIQPMMSVAGNKQIEIIDTKLTTILDMLNTVLPELRNRINAIADQAAQVKSERKSSTQSDEATLDAVVTTPEKKSAKEKVETPTTQRKRNRRIIPDDP